MLIAMKNILILSTLLFLLVGCYKLEFDGNTFYTVKGRITDSTNHAMPNFQISIANMALYRGYAISAVGYTDINGNFTLTFPASNGYYYLTLQGGYYTYGRDNSANHPYNNNNISIDTSSFQNYFANLNNIKVYKP